jgi:hypothetical protein
MLVIPAGPVAARVIEIKSFGDWANVALIREAVGFQFWYATALTDVDVPCARRSEVGNPAPVGINGTTVKKPFVGISRSFEQGHSPTPYSPSSAAAPAAPCPEAQVRGVSPRASTSSP